MSLAPTTSGEGVDVAARVESAVRVRRPPRTSRQVCALSKRGRETRVRVCAILDAEDWVLYLVAAGGDAFMTAGGGQMAAQAEPPPPIPKHLVARRRHLLNGGRGLLTGILLGLAPPCECRPASQVTAAWAGSACDRDSHTRRRSGRCELACIHSPSPRGGDVTHACAHRGGQQLPSHASCYCANNGSARILR